MFKLSAEYETIYDSLLAAIASSSEVLHEPSSIFWPMRGHKYDGDLFVIGRDLNGGDVYGNEQDFAQAQSRHRKIMAVREIAEPRNTCPMLWQTDPKRYRWRGSAFFRVMSKVSLQTDPKREDEWASWVCWSNLLKVGSPTSFMQKTQLSAGIKLLEQEITEFCPRRVLVLTGKERFSPFAEKLRLNIKWRTGFVEGIAADGDRQWVVAKYPQCKPEGLLVDEIVKAFAGQL